MVVWKARATMFTDLLSLFPSILVALQPFTRSQASSTSLQHGIVMGKMQEWTRSLDAMHSEMQKLETSWSDAGKEITTLNAQTYDAGAGTLADAITALSSSIRNLLARERIVLRFGIKKWIEGLHTPCLILHCLDETRATETGSSQLRRALVRAFAILSEMFQAQRHREQTVDINIRTTREQLDGFTAFFRNKETRQLLGMGAETVELWKIFEERLASEPEDSEEGKKMEQSTKEVAAAAFALGFLILIDSSIWGLMWYMAHVGVRMARQTLLDEYWPDAAVVPMLSMEQRTVRILELVNADSKPLLGERGSYRFITEFFKPDRVEMAGKRRSKRLSKACRDCDGMQKGKTMSKEADAGEDGQQRLITAFFRKTSGGRGADCSLGQAFIAGEEKQRVRESRGGIR